MKKKNSFAYDKEELELLQSIENGEWIDEPLSEEKKADYAQSAAYTKSLQEKRQTTIRFSVADLAVIKAKAKEQGIGYQNLIQALVHKYAIGELKLEL